MKKAVQRSSVYVHQHLNHLIRCLELLLHPPPYLGHFFSSILDLNLVCAPTSLHMIKLREATVPLQKYEGPSNQT